MMGESAKVGWHDMSQALPAFLTAILMPLTYSITTGTFHYDWIGDSRDSRFY